MFRGALINGPSTASFQYALNEIPAFVRAGKIKNYMGQYYTPEWYNIMNAAIVNYDSLFLFLITI